MDSKTAREIRDYLRQHGGLATIDKYGRKTVLAALIPED